jgi:hypothetical protein
LWPPRNASALIACNLRLRRNQIAVRDLVMATSPGNEAERGVTDDNAGSNQFLDHETCRSICDAIGARLQRDLSPWALTPSTRLERLIEEMRRREAEDRAN